MSGTAVWFPGNNRVRVRSERVDRGFAYIGETGRTCGMWLCGITRIAKRYSIAVAVHNPGLLMRKLFGCCRLRTVSATRCTKSVRPPQVIPETLYSRLISSLVSIYKYHDCKSIKFYRILCEFYMVLLWLVFSMPFSIMSDGKEDRNENEEKSDH